MEEIIPPNSNNGRFQKGNIPVNKGKPMSDEQRAKLSLAHKGRIAPNKGKKISDEQRAKMSETRRGKRLTDEQKAKRKKFKFSEETKARMSASRKGRVVSPETRLKISLSEKGKQISGETLVKLSQAAKGRTGPKGYKHDEAFRAKASARNRIIWQSRSEEERRDHLDKLHAGSLRILNSRFEEAYAKILDSQGIIYERQKQVGWYRVDFYVQATNTIIECNGCYWHCCKQCGFDNAHEGKMEKDTKRYNYLRGKGFMVEIVWEHDLPRRYWNTL